MLNQVNAKRRTSTAHPCAGLFPIVASIRHCLSVTSRWDTRAATSVDAASTERSLKDHLPRRAKKCGGREARSTWTGARQTPTMGTSQALEIAVFLIGSAAGLSDGR